VVAVSFARYCPGCREVMPAEHVHPDAAPTLFDTVGAQVAEMMAPGRDTAELVRESKARTAEAIARVDAHAEADWKAAADEAIRYCAAAAPAFTADDVWWRLEDLGVEPPHERRALGARLQAARRAGLIANAGPPVMSKRPETHGSWVAEWRSR
jgi:hypothetical protein